MSSGRLISDVQGLKSENNFIPKEPVVYSGEQLMHCFPNFISTQPLTNIQRENKWLTANFKGLDLRGLFTPLYQFKNIMSDLSKKTDVIYLKGRKKANFIRNYTEKGVLELDEKSPLPELESKCFYHLNSPWKFALSNVFYLFDPFT